MHKLLEKVERELENIADKGLTSSNLETTFKLMDIYKDIHEANYYKEETKGSYNGDRYEMRMRDGRGRYMGDDYDRYENRNGNGRYGFYPHLDERTERQLERMREGMGSYNEGRDRYRGGGSEERMIDGIEMTMGAICSFVECLFDYAETSKEKEIIRKHVEKMKKL